MSRLNRLYATPVLLILLGCSSSDGETTGGRACSPGVPSSCVCADGTLGSQACADDGASLSACVCDGSTTDPTTTDPTTTDPTTTDPTATDPTATDPTATDPTATDPTATDPTTTDPTASTQTIGGVACGGVLDANFLPPFVTLGGRDVYVDYACDKPAGTPTTFILNLHGTMGLEAGKIYQRGYFPAYNYIDTHDFIVVTPKAVGSQWGRGDNATDAPHLLETIDWVYDTFTSVDIQQMWVIGHSWGSAYTLGFACRPELEGRVSGVVLMSGGATMPTCADRLSVMATVGELDIVEGQPEQTATATAHGCEARTDFNLGANGITEWANCSPGWVHKNYFMNGKAHGFDPVDWPDDQMNQDMADAILSTR